MKNCSEVINVGMRNFRYNYAAREIQWVGKAPEGTIKENEEWFAEFGELLYEIDEDGYLLNEVYPTPLEVWNDEERRMAELRRINGRLEAELDYFINVFFNYCKH